MACLFWWRSESYVLLWKTKVTMLLLSGRSWDHFFSLAWWSWPLRGLGVLCLLGVLCQCCWSENLALGAHKSKRVGLVASMVERLLCSTSLPQPRSSSYPAIQHKRNEVKDYEWLCASPSTMGSSAQSNGSDLKHAGSGLPFPRAWANSLSERFCVFNSGFPHGTEY